jgi:hypothetical protein
MASIRRLKLISQATYALDLAATGIGYQNGSAVERNLRATAITE